MSNQDIQVSGESNTIRVFSGGKLRIGNQSVEVSGEGNEVMISGGDLHIGGSEPPSVVRGQIWAHGLLRVQVLSVDDGYASCLVRDETGEVVKDEPVELATRQIRRFYDYVGKAKPPEVKRGQVWLHNVLPRRVEVISVRNGIARCLVTDLTGLPIMSDGKAQTCDITTINIRYAYNYVSGGAS